MPTNNMPMMRTAEHVSQGHPDKACDQVVDAVLDAILDGARACAGTDESSPDHARHQRLAGEMLAKDMLMILSGEAKISDGVIGHVKVPAITRRVWSEIGYPQGANLVVLDHLQQQSPDISQGVDANGGTSEGAGDQGIMCGFATDETETMMPIEYEQARRLCRRIQDLRENGLPWLGADTKTQVTLDADDQVAMVIIAAQHADSVTDATIREALIEEAVRPVLGDVVAERVVVNGTGRFVIGGTIGDAGVVGRKIVVDAYGPAVPVGGGAYSGKDPTKVDRSAAYKARQIAKTAVRMKIRGARTCLVKLAYGIGQVQPAMVTAITDSGADISDWVRARFDLSPRAIIDSLGLLRLDERGTRWRYQDTAAWGHYGRANFPWEELAEVSD